jgi:hypothetical protein
MGVLSALVLLFIYCSSNCRLQMLLQCTYPRSSSFCSGTNSNADPCATTAALHISTVCLCSGAHCNIPCATAAAVQNSTVFTRFGTHCNANPCSSTAARQMHCKVVAVDLEFLIRTVCDTNKRHTHSAVRTPTTRSSVYHRSMAEPSSLKSATTTAQSQSTAPSPATEANSRVRRAG